MLRLRFLSALVLLLAAVAHVFAQPPAITFFETGAELRFDAADVAEVQYIDAEQEDLAYVALTLTPSMSQRLRQFTERLVGRRTMIVFQGRLLGSDTIVREAISGPVIHFSGSDGTLMRSLADGLEDQRHHAASTGQALLVSYEQVSKLELETSHMRPLRDGDTFVLKGPADATISTAMPARSDGWIAVIDEHLLDEWSVSSEDGLLEVMLHALTPSQRALLD